jgi:hypothetical protein
MYSRGENDRFAGRAAHERGYLERPSCTVSPESARFQSLDRLAIAGLPSSGGRSEPGVAERSRKLTVAIPRREFGLRDP